MVAYGPPGGRAPHVALHDARHDFGIHDLFGREFVLVAGFDGPEWVEAAQRTARDLGVTLSAYRVGDRFVDVDDSWARRYGVDSSGAVLIRPDSVIAWRAKKAMSNPGDELAHALGSVLAR